MKAQKGTTAYVDGANLHRGIMSSGWHLDYARFRVWLTDKYGVEKAYMFIGMIPKYADMYARLQRAGFILVFKEVVYDGDGRPKGNCDADLVTQAMKDVYEEDTKQAILVSSDGDYTPLVKFWQEKGVARAILSPAPEGKCSVLLRRTEVGIVYLNDKKKILEVRKSGSK